MIVVAARTMIVGMVVRVVVFVPVKRQRPLGSGAKQRPVFWRRGDVFRLPLAANMAVEADHPVRGGHDHVQFMADHQHRAAEFGPYGCDLLVKGGRAGLIKALGGFIQNQKLRVCQQRPGQKDALELPA